MPIRHGGRPAVAFLGPGRRRRAGDGGCRPPDTHLGMLWKQKRDQDGAPRTRRLPVNASGMNNSFRNMTLQISSRVSGFGVWPQIRGRSRRLSLRFLLEPHGTLRAGCWSISATRMPAGGLSYALAPGATPTRSVGRPAGVQASTCRTAACCD